MYTTALSIEATESALFNRAYLRQRQGRFPEAVEGFQAVLAANPQHAQAAAAAGTLLVQLGRHEEAVPLLAAAANLRPTQADIMFNAGALRDAAARAGTARGGARWSPPAARTCLCTARASSGGR